MRRNYFDDMSVITFDVEQYRQIYALGNEETEETA